MLSWKEVQEQLVEAVKLSWRLPSDVPVGARAADGPWHLITRLDRAGSTIEAWRQEQDEIREARGRSLAPVPLTAEEVTWMEHRIEWLALIGDRDRKLVWLAIVELARGTATSVDWGWVRSRLPLEIGRKGLYRRFARALQGLAKALNEREQLAA